MTRKGVIDILEQAIDVMASASFPGSCGREVTSIDNPRETAIAALSALEAAGVRLVPSQLDNRNLDHWKVASAGINSIEESGGQFGSDRTPEWQIADAYREMVRLAASPYAPAQKDKPE